MNRKSAVFLLFLYFIVVAFLLAIRPTPSESSYQEKPLKKPTQIQYLIKIIQSKQPKLKPTTAKEIAKSVQTYSKKFNFPKELILALIETESTFKPKAVSISNCKGLMQIKESAHPEKINENDNLFNINTNIRIGCQILFEYYNQTGTIKKALFKYRGKKSNYYVSIILSRFTDLLIEKNLMVS